MRRLWGLHRQPKNLELRTRGKQESRQANWPGEFLARLPILQILPVYHFPLSGREQAEFMKTSGNTTSLVLVDENSLVSLLNIEFLHIAIQKGNRKRSKYHCKQCQFQLHADWNAAINIRDNYILSSTSKTSEEQAVVIQPHVTIGNNQSQAYCLVQ